MSTKLALTPSYLRGVHLPQEKVLENIRRALASRTSIPTQLLFTQQQNFLRFAERSAVLRAATVQSPAQCTALVPAKLPAVQKEFFGQEPMVDLDHGCRLDPEAAQEIDLFCHAARNDLPGIAEGEFAIDLGKRPSRLLMPLEVPVDGAKIAKELLGDPIEFPASNSERVVEVTDEEAPAAAAAPAVAVDSAIPTFDELTAIALSKKGAQSHDEMAAHFSNEILGDVRAEERSILSAIGDFFCAPIHWIGRLFASLRECLGL